MVGEAFRGGNNTMITHRRLSHSATAALALAAAVPGAAQDSSVQNRLEEAGLKYKVDEDGDYTVVFDYSAEGRTQLAYVSGTTQTVSGITIREIFAPAGRVKENGVDGAKALELLAESSRNKVGSWEIRGNIVFFVIKVPDDTTAEELKALLNVAAGTADDLEIELTGGKDDL